jgi:hypothetical protein
MTAAQLATAEFNADKAMGVELMAIEIEEQIEWAEAQGRRDDAAALARQLGRVLNELADIAEAIPAAA